MFISSCSFVFDCFSQVVEADRHRSSLCNEAVRAVREDAIAAHTAISTHQSRWAIAEQKATEQSNLLQACTYQNIGTVHDMSNRFYELQ